MAWSNVRKEPRREITEQILGVVVGGGWIYACWTVAHPLGLRAAFDVPGQYIFPVIFTIAFAIGAPVVLIATWHSFHWVGEIICGLMAALGFDPRPRDRY